MIYNVKLQLNYNTNENLAKYYKHYCKLFKNYKCLIGKNPLTDNWKTTNRKFSSVAQLGPTLCEPMDCSMPGLCPLPTPGVNSNSCPLSRYCHPTLSSSVIPFSFCLQSFPASGSFQMGQFFTSGGQSIEVSASAPVFPMNIQDWFPLRWTGWISLQSKGLSRVFNTIVLNHHFFGTQLSL